MNQLSQLLYWGNVLGNLGPLFAITGGGILVILAIYIITASAEHFFDKKYLFALPIAFLFLLLAAFCPSQETVYAIAASEVGGKVLSSPTGDLATQALNSWLKRQITPRERH